MDERPVPGDRLKAWAQGKFLLHLIIDEVSDLFTELCLRGCQPQITIKHEIHNEYQVFVTVPVSKTLNHIQITQLSSLSELFACSVMISAEAQGVMAITYHGFETIEKKLNEQGQEPESESEPPPAPQSNPDTDDQGMSSDDDAEEDGASEDEGACPGDNEGQS